jgi:glycosyltransferase involved in cell wall biosynthesis
MKSDKIVVLLTPGFPENEQDTTCTTFLQDYVLSFIRLNPDVNLKIITFQYPFKEGSYKWNNVNVYSAGGKNTKYPGRIFTWIRVWKQLLKINKETKITILHSFWLTECSLIAYWFSKIYHIKHIAYLIGQDVFKNNKYLPFLNLNKIKLVAMSESIGNELFKTSGHHANNIIPLGVNITKTNFPQINQRDIDIIGVGSLIPLKNYELFIDIIKELKNSFPEIKSCVIGGGPEYDNLHNKIINNHLEANIELKGEIKHEKVFDIMNKSKIFLHTSSYEGQSTVMMEALSCGLTVVCFDVGRFHSIEKMHVCSDKESMIKSLKELLSKNNLNYEPIILQTMDDTVNDFVKLYNE